MYVKLYQRILDSSIARDKRLRHFFIDMLLLADQEGFVVMTPGAIARRTGWEEVEVVELIGELMKEDKESFSESDGGRRIVPLDGSGYGWKIVNYELYRDYKNSSVVRAANRDRVKAWRARRNEYAKRKRSGKEAIEAAKREGASEAVRDGIAEAEREAGKESIEDVVG